MLPTVPRIRSEAERAGLVVRDVYSFGADYARTLRDWRVRFDGAKQAIAALGYDHEFRRGWHLSGHVRRGILSRPHQRASDRARPYESLIVAIGDA